MTAVLQVPGEVGLLLPDQLALVDRLLSRPVLPTGPDRLPLCTPESRSGGVWSSGSHTAWSVGMSRTRHESSRRYDARVASRELHIGR